MRALSLALAGLVSTVVSTGAFAQADKPATLTAKPGFQLRIDSLGVHKTVDDAPTTDSQTFDVKTARFGLTGDLGEGISYTLRLDMKNAFFGSETVGADRSIAALDRAYLEHKVCEGVSFRLGRMPFFSLSIENDYSSIDQYFYSYTSDYVGRYLTPINAGADLTATMAGQSIVLQAANGLQEGTAKEDKGTQKGENVNLALGYRGNLANGMVKPIISYNRFSRIRGGTEPNRDDKVNITAYGIGSQFTFAQADLDLEYDAVNRPTYLYFATDSVKKTTSRLQNLETKFTSFVAQIAYRATELKLRPWIKYASDVVKQDGETVVKSARSGLGAEYRPVGKNFRYHVAYLNGQDQDITAATTVKTTTVQYILGAAAKM